MKDSKNAITTTTPCIWCMCYPWQRVKRHYHIKARQEGAYFIECFRGHLVDHANLICSVVRVCVRTINIEQQKTYHPGKIYCQNLANYHNKVCYNYRKLWIWFNYPRRCLCSSFSRWHFCTFYLWPARGNVSGRWRFIQI